MHSVRCWFGVTGNILYEKLMIKAYQRLSQLLIRLIKRCIAHDSCFYQSPFYHLHSNFHCTLSADHSKDDLSLYLTIHCVLPCLTHLPLLSGSFWQKGGRLWWEAEGPVCWAGASWIPWDRQASQPSLCEVRRHSQELSCPMVGHLWSRECVGWFLVDWDPELARLRRML